MKKAYLLLALIALTTLKATSQGKQPDSVVRSKPADLRIIIENNERGNRAQALVPVLQNKIEVLETNAGLYERQLQSKDSTISEQRVQVVNLLQVVANCQTINENKDREIAIERKIKEQAIRAEKRARRKVVFVGIAGALSTAAGVYIAIKAGD